MRKTRSFLAAGLLVALLTACGPGGGPTPTPPPTPTAVMPTTVGLTTCSPGQLAAPPLSSPAMWAVVDNLSPTLSWSPNEPPSVAYPYPYADCHPGGYDVNLGDIPSLWGAVVGNTPNGTTDWTPSTPLLPGREYAWRVSATTGGTDGPSSNQRIFFTGPVCATADLVAPDLIGPPNGSQVPTLNPSLSWQYPNPCLPQGYRIDLSIESAFVNTSLSGGTGNPSTTWAPGADLTDCTWYYWRVAPINDITLGPYSTTRTFRTDFSGTCAPVGGPTVIIVTPPGIILTVPVIGGTAVLPPIFHLGDNVNCRKGPGVEYGVVTSYLAGQEFPVDGRNDASTWVRLKVNVTARCWVAVSSGQFSGDVPGLPVLPDPPTPIPTVVPGKPSATPVKNNLKP